MGETQASSQRSARPESLPCPMGSPVARLLQLPLRWTRQSWQHLRCSLQRAPEPEAPTGFPCIPDPQKQETITIHVKMLHLKIVCYRANNNAPKRVTALADASGLCICYCLCCDASPTLPFPPSPQHPAGSNGVLLSSASHSQHHRPLFPAAPQLPLELSSLHAPLTWPCLRHPVPEAQSPAKAPPALWAAAGEAPGP